MKDLAFPQSRSSKSDTTEPLEAAGVEFIDENGGGPGLGLCVAVRNRCGSAQSPPRLQGRNDD